MLGTTSLFGAQRAVNRPAVLAWDGRLDNRNDLRLQLKGVLEADSGDAGLALAAYERWGIAGLGKLVGDWTTVIRDAHTVVLASDFMGVRPLYYRLSADSVRWSSTLESLVDSPDADRIDEDFVAGFVLMGGRSNHTPYAGILPVPPGHAVCVGSQGTVCQSFWALPTDNRISYLDERLYDEHLLALFRESVAVRLAGEGPVLAELSGGLDSSSIVCMARRLIEAGSVACRRLATVSYVHNDSRDVPFIRDVEQHCGIKGIHLSTRQHPLITDLDAGGETPQAWGPLHRAVTQSAREIGASVLLTGMNGDLIMGNWLDDSLQTAAFLRAGRLGLACREALAWSKAIGVPVLWILWRAAQAALPSSLTPLSVYQLDGLPQTVGLMAPFTRSFRERTGADEPLTWFSSDWRKAPPERRKHFLSFTLARELRSLQAPSALRGIDYTHPFAHRPLVEFLLRVPPSILCQPGEPRRLMRRALGDLWPTTLRRRRSKGLFGTPWAQALGPLAARILALRTWHVVERGWVEPAKFSASLQRLAQGLECEAPLRQLVLLEHWLAGRAMCEWSSVERAVSCGR